MDIFNKIVQEETTDPRVDVGHYVPETDASGSLALVAYMRGSELERTPGCVNTLATIGNGIFWAFDFDPTEIEQGWVETLDQGRYQDGLYVLECSWHGGGEDAEFLVDEIRELNDEERFQISENGEMEAVTHAWVSAWKDTPCRCCGRTGSEHDGQFLLECPKEDA